MILGGLLDLGANPQAVRDAVSSISGRLKGCKSVRIETTETKRGEFRACRAEVKVKETDTTRSGSQLLRAAEAVSRDASFNRVEQKLVLDSLRTLIHAEATLHDESMEKVALDEAGSADTLADVIGSVAALRDLGISRGCDVYSLPIAVGGGLFRFSHGIVQSPAPAVISIASEHHLAIHGGPVEAELATPTGVSILATLAKWKVVEYPAFTPEKVGYGAGRKNFQEMPNVLRVVLGRSGLHAESLEEVALLETNLDDVTGEVLGYTMERLLDAGALDVHILSAIGKKNRPAQILRVVCKPELREALARIIFEETGTLGIRLLNTMRTVASRGTQKVGLRLGSKSYQLRVKVSRDLDGRILGMKPEYEDVAKLSRDLRMPFRRLSEMALREAESQIESKSGHC